MSYRTAIYSLLLLGLLSGSAAAQRRHPAAVPRRHPVAAPQPSVDYARRKVYPALVNITVVMRYFTGGRAQRTPGGGSGVIVTPQGHVLTNYHVAGNTTRIVCTMTDGESVPATVVAHDPATDLSVLKLRLDRRNHPNAPVPYAKLGNSDALEVGQPVIAMGNPLMLSSSLTVGVVSNKKRVFTDFTGTQMEEQELDNDEKTGMFTRWIQHDALILPGNSGGPLVNLRGEVVGINELGGSGMGFAIPSNTAASVLRQALKYGKVQRGWIGITVLPVSKINRTTGALVSAVEPRSPAAKAGLMPGDILTRVGSSPVAVRFFEEVPLLYQRIADMPIGASVPIGYLRNGSPRTASVTIARMAPYTGDEQEIRDLGLTVRGITDAMALSRHLPTRDGVLVTGIRPGYRLDSANPKVQEGDIITAIDGKSVPSLEAFHRVVTHLDRGREVGIAFRRQEEQLVTAVKPQEEPSAEQGGELPKPWLGITTQVVTPEVARALGRPDVKGFRVTQVYPWTAAGRAGLRPGDIIMALNGAALQASRLQDAEDLKRAIEDLPVGGDARITVLRNGKPQEVAVKLEPDPTPQSDLPRVKDEEFEFTIRNIAPTDRMAHHWEGTQKGVLVTDVVTGGWAHMAGLHVDDLIQGVHNHPVPDAATFQKVMRQVKAERPKVIEIFVLRGYRTHFVFIEPEWERKG